MRAGSKTGHRGGCAGSACESSRMTEAAHVWDVPAEFNFARDVLDALAREDRRGLLFVDAAGKRREFSFAEIAEAVAALGCRAARRRRAQRRPRRRRAAEDPGLAVLHDRAAAHRRASPCRARSSCARRICSTVRITAARRRSSRTTATRRSSTRCAPTPRPARRGCSSAASATAGPPPTRCVARAQPWDGEPTRADDMAYIVYTSGTTKDPERRRARRRATRARSACKPAVWFDVQARRLGVVHGRYRLGEIALERVARAVVVRRADRAARGRHSSPKSGWT